MLTYQIVSESMQWSYVFGALEGSKQQLGIIDYSVSQTTLEQVYIWSHRDIVIVMEIIKKVKKILLF